MIEQSLHPRFITNKIRFLFEAIAESMRQSTPKKRLDESGPQQTLKVGQFQARNGRSDIFDCIY